MAKSIVDLMRKKNGDGEFRGTVTEENMEYLKKVAALEKKRPTMLCNQMLNAYLRELQKICPL